MRTRKSGDTGVTQILQALLTAATLTVYASPLMAQGTVPSPASTAAQTADQYKVLDVQAAIQQNKIACVMQGNGISTTSAQLLIKNCSNEPLQIVVASNTFFVPTMSFCKKLLNFITGTQTMLIRADSVIYLPPGDGVVNATMKTYCMSVQTIPPPQNITITNQSKGSTPPTTPHTGGTGNSGANGDMNDLFNPKDPSYVAVRPGAGAYSIDVDSLQKIVDIASAGESLEHSPQYGSVKVGANPSARKSNIVQLSIWKYLGNKSGNEADKVTKTSIVKDQVKALTTSAATDAALLEKIKGTGAKLSYKNGQLQSIQLPESVQQKFLDSADSLLTAVDLTLDRSAQGNLALVTLPITQWNSYYDVGSRAYKDGDFIEGDTLLSAAVDEAKTFGEADKRYSLSLLTRGELQSDTANWLQADALLSKSLNLRERVNGKTSFEVAEAENDVGVMHQREGDYQKADQYFNDAYENGKNAGPTAKAFSINALENEGRNLLLEGDASGAQNKLQQAMALSLSGAEKVDNNPDLAEIETYLAKAKMADGATQDLGNAEQLLDRAYQVAQLSMGPDHPFLAVILQTQASLYDKMHDQSRYAARMELVNKALAPLTNTFKQVVNVSDLSYDTLARLKKYAVDKFTIAINREKLDSLAAGVRTDVARKQNNSPIGDKWAVVIGISKFKDQSINLKYSAKDAQDFADFLVDNQHFAPDHVHVLLDEQATLSHIKSEVGDKFLANFAHKNDMVVIYLSSHGSSDKVDRRGANFFVAYDTDKNDLYATGLQMPNLVAMIRERIDCDRVAVFLDSCHSGALQKSGVKGLFRVNNFDASEISQGTGQLVVCSSQSDESSWESLRYANGVFTHYLMDSLKTSGSKNLDDVFKEMSIKVSDEVQHDRNESQKPVLSGSGWQGQSLVLGVQPTEKRPGAPQLYESSMKVFGNVKPSGTTSIPPSSAKQSTSAVTKSTTTSAAKSAVPSANRRTEPVSTRSSAVVGKKSTTSATK